MKTKSVLTFGMAAAIVAGVVIYGIKSPSAVTPTDHNIPGKTTGPGRNSLTSPQSE